MQRKRAELAFAEQRVAAAKKIVADQRELIATLTASGQSVIDATKALQVYLGMLKHLEDYKRGVKKRLQTVRQRQSARLSAPCGPGFVSVDLAYGEHRIGAGKVELLEAIQSTGSITAAARTVDMSYKTAWMLVAQINRTLHEPAVTGEVGGAGGGGAVVTLAGEQMIGLYRSIEARTQAAAADSLRRIGKLVRH